jgi:hypothetical protein
LKKDPKVRVSSVDRKKTPPRENNEGGRRGRERTDLLEPSHVYHLDELCTLFGLFFVTEALNHVPF